MDTTAAALEAHVTADTIRTWCRIGAVDAVKTAGRWVIDTASLAHRIAIGLRKARMQSTPGTMSARGEEYVANWPTSIANRFQVGVEWTATTLIDLGFAEKADEGRIRRDALKGAVIPEVARLTPSQAQQIAMALAEKRRRLNATVLTHCHYCSLELTPNGECPSCGNLEY
ncbi:hypothetical protein AB0451_02965 [Streptomyces sp. NPDC052000]|uniref:hypothetical protein n=1 Tax=Streptomyces sp. NPDC052000 TaxID=3155676 RepID=UPI00344E58C8